MDPIIGGLITGGASLLGGLFSSQTSAANTQAQIANQQAMQMQAEQYNTQMSNTAYQRGVADMKAAGLNPAMMFGSGGPASSPTIGAPTAPTPQKTSPLGGLGDAVKSGINTAVTAETYNKLIQEVANLKVQQGLVAAQTDVEQKRVGKTVAETDLTAQEAERVARQLPVATLQGATAKDIMSSPEGLRRAANIAGFYGGKLSDVIAPFFSGASSLYKMKGLLSGGY